MVTGDRADAAETIGAALDLDAVLADREPADKVDAVASERRRYPTAMVGDGIRLSGRGPSAITRAMFHEYLMCSSVVPAVPWMSRVESPEIAAARCSETQLLAVPGTPSKSRARSVASVEIATSINRRLPIYLGDTLNPLSSSPPKR